MFGGDWTQQKLQVLSKYIRAYRMIFDRNEHAKYFRVSYVDAFAGTGVIPRPDIQAAFAELIPSLAAAEAEFRKGSVRRALEVEPPFHHYVFIEKDRAKCEELLDLKSDFPGRDINVVNGDANAALLEWCRKLNVRRDRAIVFLDPFGASIEWDVVEAIGKTNAVDLWILFPYGAVNRMLTRSRKPLASWTSKLTRIFGTDTWEDEFYSSNQLVSIFDPNAEIESIHKTADPTRIVNYFVAGLRTVFAEVARPGLLFNSKGLLFVLFFATGNKTGLKIANDLLRNLTS
jgi:three-Cys-motif partner protein